MDMKEKKLQFSDVINTNSLISRSKTVFLSGSLQKLGQRNDKSRIIDNKFCYHNRHQQYHHPHRPQYYEGAGNGMALHEIWTNNEIDNYHRKPCCYTENVCWQLNEIFLERLKTITRNGDNKEVSN